MTDVEEWLEKCPQPVIARVIKELPDFNHILTTSHVYQKNTLVVIDLEKLAALFQLYTTKHGSIV